MPKLGSAQIKLSRSDYDARESLPLGVENVEQEVAEFIVRHLASGHFEETLGLLRTGGVRHLSLDDQNRIKQVAEFVLLDRVASGRHEYVKQISLALSPSLLSGDDFSSAFLEGVRVLVVNESFSELEEFIAHFKVPRKIREEAQRIHEEAIVNYMSNPANDPLRTNSGDVFSSKRFHQSCIQVIEGYLSTGQYLQALKFFERHPALRVVAEDTQEIFEEALIANPRRVPPEKLFAIFEMREVLESERFQLALQGALRAEFLRESLDGVAILLKAYPITDDTINNLKDEVMRFVPEMITTLRGGEDLAMNTVNANPILWQAYQFSFGVDRRHLRMVIDSFRLPAELHTML